MKKIFALGLLGFAANASTNQVVTERVVIQQQLPAKSLRAQQNRGGAKKCNHAQDDKGKWRGQRENNSEGQSGRGRSPAQRGAENSQHRGGNKGKGEHNRGEAASNRARNDSPAENGKAWGRDKDNEGHGKRSDSPAENGKAWGKDKDHEGEKGNHGRGKDKERQNRGRKSQGVSEREDKDQYHRDHENHGKGPVQGRKDNDPSLGSAP